MNESKESEPPTPPPSRASSLEPSQISKKASGPFQSIPLPLNSSKASFQKYDKTLKSKFFDNYNLNRLYALYGIYYKLCNPKPDEDKWAYYDSAVNKLKTHKENFNKGKETQKMNQSLEELVVNIEEYINLFNEKLIDISEKEKFVVKELDEAEKIKHYSRFNRIFKNHYNPKGEGILSLLHVYDCEVKLWREAIPPPFVNPEENLPLKQNVATSEESKKSAVKSFLDRFDKKPLDCSDETGRTYTDGEEYIRVYISILDKIAVSEYFKKITTNMTVSLTEQRKEKLKEELETNISEIITLKGKIGSNPSSSDFDKIKEILEETTTKINEVEKYLDEQINIMDKKDFVSLLQDGIVEKKMI